MIQSTETLSSRMSPGMLIAWVRGLLTPPRHPETHAEANERREAMRTEGGAELLKLDAQAATELKALEKAEDRARTQLEALVPGYQEALRTYDEARMAHARRAADLDYARQRAARQIEANADPVISEFMSGLMELHQATIGTQVVEEERNGLWHPEAEALVFETWSNAPSIEARASAILAVYHQVEAVKFDPDQSEIRERLATLIEDLPSVDTLVKVYTPPAREPSRRWPTYEEARAEMIGRQLPDPSDRRRNIARSGLSRLVG